jgi:serine/threonine-protein kinase
MSLTAGSHLGPYEIISPLGAGGMGEVYRARDTKLGRDVALKILPESFVHDPDRVARFRREAQVLASLNHPHIAAIYGLEEANNSQFLVLELVEGGTLADRLKSGPLPVEEALTVARQIADALEAAHEKGIIHRDLKPANIAFTSDNQAKVLDFGLAKALEPVAAVAGDMTASPTITTPAMTQMGMILGTAAYMSPEQAKGRPADKRTDVWAFGCVLYEMLTGKRAFDGEDVSDTLAFVITKEPDWSTLPTNTPASIRRVLQRCVQKDRKRRLRDIGDARLELDEAPVDEREGRVLLTPRMAPSLFRRPFAITAMILGVALVASALTGLFMWTLRPTTPMAVLRFPFTLPEGQTFTNPGRRMLAISPDGTQMVYVANRRLYLRSMAELDSRPMAGTENLTSGVTSPTFSPDGRWIAFWASADQTLKRIAVPGGVAVPICPADNPFGVQWVKDEIIFSQADKGILRVSASGGKPEPVVSVKEGEVVDEPQVLPDGQTILFSIAKGTGIDRWDKAQIMAQSLKSGERKKLIQGGSDAHYVATGHLVYAIGGSLYVVPFDLRTLSVRGGPVPILEGIRRRPPGGTNTGTAQFSLAENGTLIYVPGPTSSSAGALSLALLDRKGTVTPLKVPDGPYATPRVSPDGKQIAYGSDDGKEAIVWIYDLAATGAPRRLTFGGRNRFPIWSADGQWVVFQSDREGDQAIWRQRADLTGTVERLTKPDRGTSHVPQSWQPRGDRFLFSVATENKFSLWTFSPHDRNVAPFGGVQSTVAPTASFSPDGRWVVYSTSDGSGQALFVQPFPATGNTFQIARSGRHPMWSPDGKELLFTVGVSQLSAASISTQPTFTVGNPAPTPTPGFILELPTIETNFSMTPDGRFVAVVPAGQRESEIQIVLNWFEELKARVSTK